MDHRPFGRCKRLYLRTEVNFANLSAATDRQLRPPLPYMLRVGRFLCQVRRSHRQLLPRR